MQLDFKVFASTLVVGGTGKLSSGECVLNSPDGNGGGRLMMTRRFVETPAFESLETYKEPCIPLPYAIGMDINRFGT